VRAREQVARSGGGAVGWHDRVAAGGERRRDVVHMGLVGRGSWAGLVRQLGPRWLLA
jgi:hypothetical protein